MLKSAPVGFSWTTFFFGPFPALFRGDLKWFIIMLIVGVFTIWIANFIIFGAIYNKRYLVDLMSKGFTPADEHSRNVLAQKGIVITGGPLPANQSVPQPTPVVTPAPPAAPTPGRYTKTSKPGVSDPRDRSIPRRHHHTGRRCHRDRLQSRQGQAGIGRPSKPRARRDAGTTERHARLCLSVIAGSRTARRPRAMIRRHEQKLARRGSYERYNRTDASFLRRRRNDPEAGRGELPEARDSRASSQRGKCPGEV